MKILNIVVEGSTEEAFPRDDASPYAKSIQAISDSYEKIAALEKAIKNDIKHTRFIPYVQLHEFEAFLLASPDTLLVMYPDKASGVNRLKKDIEGLKPETINSTPQNAPSKRIIKYISEYEAQKAQVGPLVAGDIGLTALREACPHFNEWLTTLEGL